MENTMQSRAMQLLLTNMGKVLEAAHTLGEIDVAYTAGRLDGILDRKAIENVKKGAAA